MTNAEARFNNSLRPQKPEGSLGRTAQDVHLDSHTAPELCDLSAYHTYTSYSVRQDQDQNVQPKISKKTLFSSSFFVVCFVSALPVFLSVFVPELGAANVFRQAQDQHH